MARKWNRNRRGKKQQHNHIQTKGNFSNGSQRLCGALAMWCGVSPFSEVLELQLLIVKFLEVHGEMKEIVIMLLQWRFCNEMK